MSTSPASTPLADMTIAEMSTNSSPNPMGLSKLPPELLAHVFEVALLSFEGGGSIQKYRFPSIVSQVSHLFRRLALSTPVLWSYIYATPQHANIAHNYDRIRLRSGVLPLDIYASLDPPETPILEILETCSSRWRRLCLTMDEPGGIDWNLATAEDTWIPLCRVLLGAAPQLRSLVIENGPLLKALPPPLVLPPINAPIQTLWLEGCTFWFHGTLPATLQTLYIRNHALLPLDPSAVVGIIQGPIALSLSSLSLNGCAFNFTLTDVSVVFKQSVTLEKLEFLEIRDVDGPTAMTYFHILQTPRLQHLSLQVVKYNGDTQPSLLRLLHGWESLRLPTLKELTVAGMCLPEGSRLVDVLCNLPVSLTRLNIVQDLQQPIDDVLLALEAPDTTDLCARMESLGVSGLHIGRVAGLVEGRFISLKELELDIKDCAHNGDDDPDLREVDRQLARLRGMVPAMRIVGMRDYYASVLPDEPDPYLRGWKQLEERKSKSDGRI